jgi:hypothetical protein
VRESVELKMALTYLARPNSSQKEPALVVTVEPFLFGSATDRDPPLSWHLTGLEKKEIGAAWEISANQASWGDVRSRLGCSNDPEILERAEQGTD